MAHYKILSISIRLDITKFISALTQKVNIPIVGLLRLFKDIPALNTPILERRTLCGLPVGSKQLVENPIRFGSRQEDSCAG